MAYRFLWGASPYRLLKISKILKIHPFTGGFSRKFPHGGWLSEDTSGFVSSSGVYADASMVVGPMRIILHYHIFFDSEFFNSQKKSFE